jgi:1,4-alpha-glucan branching enzyme
MNNSNRLKQDERQRKYEDVHFVDSTRPVWNYSLFSQEDIDNFQRGTHYRLYELFGAHEREVFGKLGYYFAVWAPNATYISVIGNFNDWDNTTHPLFVRLESSGIWEGFIPDIPKGESYKYHIHGYQGKRLDKGDPYANFWEKRPATASSTWDLDMTGTTGNEDKRETQLSRCALERI